MPVIFSADIGIRSLLDKALITTTSYNNFIDMHDLLQEIEKLFVKNVLKILGNAVDCIKKMQNYYKRTNISSIFYFSGNWCS